jgi:ABC-type dipeptide/oligopeptide/nickel transport system permease subunit
MCACARSAISELTKDYVTAAKVAGGASGSCCQRCSQLPRPAIVQAALGISDAILAAAGLLLGSAQPPHAG